MTLSISLVTFNGAKLIRACLESVCRQTLRDVEVIIVDNASTDDTVAIVREICPNAIIISNKKNLGFAAAHNQAIAKATGEYILVLNQDASLEPEYCEKLVDFMKKNPSVGSATGTIVRCESLTERPKNPIIDSQGMFLKNRYFVRLLGEGEAYKEGEREPKEVFGIPATVALYRKSALDDVALPLDGRHEVFDEDFFMYKEDVDLAYRLQWRGWKSYLVPDAHCWHIRTKRGGSRPHRWINELSYRNTILCEWKNISFDLFVWVWPSIVSYEAAKLLYSLLREPSSLLRIRDLWRLRSRMKRKRAWIMRNRKADPKELLKFY
ncbi:glycosyltransferase family 2 protein [Candidatus Uhrbacteria bacterium]|nr:glycosyltransferase family 2 protein [Candidatus Uhrbacteria bacterium]